MMQPGQFGKSDLILFLLILAAAAGVRVGYVTLMASGGPEYALPHVQDDDSGEILALVNRLKEAPSSFGGADPLRLGDEPNAHRAPGYPWLLALLARVLPHWERLVPWLQCGLGTLAAGFWFLFARRAFNSALAAFLAGLLCALHPFWVINTAETNDGVLTSFLLAAAVCLGARGSQSGGAFTSLLYGLSLASLALVRAALLPFAFVALLWFLWRCRESPRGWFFALLAFLGFANGLVPWALRNIQELGEVVPVADSAPFHLWMGNNPWATGGPQSPAEIRLALAQDPHLPAGWARRLDQKRLCADCVSWLAAAPDGDLPANLFWAGWCLSELARPPLPRSERARALLEAAWKAVEADPAAALRRRLWAGLYFVFGEEWFTHGRLWQAGPGTESSQSPPLPPSLAAAVPVVLNGTLLGMLLLAALGWRWSYGWRREAMPLSLAVIWVPLPYLLSHAEALSGPRLPLDGGFLCYAAFALACLVPRVGGRLLEGPESSSRDLQDL
jgi:hypothetical protein